VYSAGFCEFCEFCAGFCAPEASGFGGVCRTSAGIGVFYSRLQSVESLRHCWQPGTYGISMLLLLSVGSRLWVLHSMAPAAAVVCV
jgi:hypothetical protein